MEDDISQVSHWLSGEVTDKQGKKAGMIHVVELGQAEKLGMEDMVRGTASGIHNQSHSAFKL